MPISVGMKAHELRKAHLRAANRKSWEDMQEMLLLCHVSKDRRY